MSSDDERCESARTCDSCMYCRVCQARRQQGNWIAELCDTYQRRIDREALLALADICESTGNMYEVLCSESGDGAFYDLFRKISEFDQKVAIVIRDVLGVEHG